MATLALQRRAATQGQTIGRGQSIKQRRNAHRRQKVRVVMEGGSEDSAAEEANGQEGRGKLNAGRGMRQGKQGKSGKKGQGQGQNQRKEPKYEERIIEVRRVTKVIQGGRSVSFRACMCIGNRQGTVGVGVDKAKEVSEAIEKARNKAIKTAISVPLTRNSSVPHEARVKGGGGTEIDIYPAGIGTGVNAGGACRPVMELAGVQNIFVKQRRSRNYINNAMAVVQGLERMQSARDTCRLRGFSSIKELFSAKDDPAVTNV